MAGKEEKAETKLKLIKKSIRYDNDDDNEVMGSTFCLLLKHLLWEWIILFNSDFLFVNNSDFLITKLVGYVEDEEQVCWENIYQEEKE